MQTSLYPLTCPLCRQKLAHAGTDGELLLYTCRQHGTVVLCSDGRIWVEELPHLSVLDVPASRRMPAKS
jgi:hypothetical protein